MNAKQSENAKHNDSGKNGVIMYGQPGLLTKDWAQDSRARAERLERLQLTPEQLEGYDKAMAERGPRK